LHRHGGSRLLLSAPDQLVEHAAVEGRSAAFDAQPARVDFGSR
jgi:hypothetical protein